jgi:hypothetical protein
VREFANSGPVAALLFGKPLEMFDYLCHFHAKGHRKVLPRVKRCQWLSSKRSVLSCSILAEVVRTTERSGIRANAVTNR